RKTKHIFVLSSRRRHTNFSRDWSSDVCSSDLVVTAPWAAAFTDIEAVLWRRRHWILRHRRQTAALPPPIPPREWVSGETHRYLRSEERRVVKECRSVGVSRHRHRVSALVMAVG